MATFRASRVRADRIPTHTQSLSRPLPTPFRNVGEVAPALGREAGRVSEALERLPVPSRQHLHHALPAYVRYGGKETIFSKRKKRRRNAQKTIEERGASRSVAACVPNNTLQLSLIADTRERTRAVHLGTAKGAGQRHPATRRRSQTRVARHSGPRQEDAQAGPHRHRFSGIPGRIWRVRETSPSGKVALHIIRYSR